MSIVTLDVFTLLQHFVGNHNGETITSNNLCPDLTARVLRFYPIAWNTTIAMRVGVVASKNGKLCDVYVTAFFIVCFGNFRWTSELRGCKLTRLQMLQLLITIRYDTLFNVGFTLGLKCI